MNDPNLIEEKPHLKVYYDGDCPFCRRYADLVQLRTQYHVHLKNAREHIQDLQVFRKAGYDINQGMIVTIADDIFHGAKAISLLEEKSGHKFRAILFRAFYPLMKYIRKLSLPLLGRSIKINY